MPDTVRPKAAPGVAEAEAGAPRENRIASRQSYVHFLWFCRLEEGKERGVARTVDVSERGVGFVTTQKVTPGDRLFLVLVTPFGRVAAIARVMHAQPTDGACYRVGATLEIVPPTDNSAWAKLVAKEAR